MALKKMVKCRAKLSLWNHVMVTGGVALLIAACGDDNSSDNPSDNGITSESDIIEAVLTDSRDGRTYRTVTIGSQTWMSENLNYATIEGSNCYDKDEVYCFKYGRLYSWAAAMDSVGVWSANGKDCGFGSTCSPTYPVRGVCPSGWHLPTEAEWNTLFATVGGRSTAGLQLKSTSGWNSGGNGKDAFGFAALPAGTGWFEGNLFYSVDRDSVCSEGNYATFWSVNEIDNHSAYVVTLGYRGGDARLTQKAKFNGYSVRCLKD